MNPALALILVALYDATPVQVGWVLAVYNASGFVASLIVPGYADRRQNYLGPMLICGVLTLALAFLLASATQLPVAVIGLVVLGGPAGVGSSLLSLQLNVLWAGIALGVSAGLEIPALLLIGRLSARVGSLRLIVTGCLAGIATTSAWPSPPARSCCWDCRY